MSRLPVPGSDDNVWGDILNDYLGVSLGADGTLNSGTVGSAQIIDGSITAADINASAGIARTQLSTGVQSSLSSADSALQSVPDASASTKGALQLTGDLGGTAASPSVPGLAAKAPLNSPAFTGSPSSTQYQIRSTTGSNGQLYSRFPQRLTFQPDVSDGLSFFEVMQFNGMTFELQSANAIAYFQAYGSDLTVRTSSSGTLKLDSASGTISVLQPMAFNANKITGVADPTLAQDAATKNYVDTTVGAAGGITRSIAAISGATTAAAAALKDYVYYWTGSIAYTLTMPTAVGNANRYTLKNASSVAQTVATTASQTIEGATTITITASNSVDLISNGSNWMVI